MSLHHIVFSSGWVIDLSLRLQPTCFGSCGRHWRRTPKRLYGSHIAVHLGCQCRRLHFDRTEYRRIDDLVRAQAAQQCGPTPFHTLRCVPGATAGRRGVSDRARCAGHRWPASDNDEDLRLPASHPDDTGATTGTPFPRPVVSLSIVAVPQLRLLRFRTHIRFAQAPTDTTFFGSPARQNTSILPRGPPNCRRSEASTRVECNMLGYPTKPRRSLLSIRMVGTVSCIIGMPSTYNQTQASRTAHAKPRASRSGPSRVPLQRSLSLSRGRSRRRRRRRRARS